MDVIILFVNNNSYILKGYKVEWIGKSYVYIWNVEFVILFFLCGIFYSIYFL